MKVLYLTTMYPTPAYPQQGIFCHEQVKALNQEGVDVTVVVPIPFYSRQKERRWTYEGVEIQYIRFLKFPGAGDFHRTGKALYRQLRKRLNLGEFDLYHADAALPSGYAAMLASKKYGKPFVVHGHGLDVFLDGSYAGTKNCEKIAAACALVYEKANAVIGVSQKVLDKIQARVDISNKAYVAYNGVDVEKFHPIKKEENEKLTITTIGNLIPLKGHEYTLRAVKELVEKGYKNIQLIIAGRGEQEEFLKQLTAELRLEQFVQFVGYIPYAHIAKLLQNADAFVLPSYYEALGCVYLEAMACGIPAVGCKENGIDEVITHGETGYLIENKSLEQLTACMEYLFDPAERHRIGENARNAVVRQYQWKHSADALKAVYERCAGRGNTHGV